MVEYINTSQHITITHDILSISFKDKWYQIPTKALQEAIEDYLSEKTDLNEMSEEITDDPQFVTFTTDGIVGITIKNTAGETYHSTSADNLRKLLHEAYLSLPAENRRERP